MAPIHTGSTTLLLNLILQVVMGISSTASTIVAVHCVVNNDHEKLQDAEKTGCAETDKRFQLTLKIDVHSVKYT